MASSSSAPKATILFFAFILMFYILSEKRESRGLMHQTKTSKGGAIYEKDAEELSSQGFSRDKKQVVSKIKNTLAFVHL